MANEHSTADLLEFLAHAGDRGLMPAATAQAMAVASRNVLSVLTQEEQADLRGLDLEAVIKRFMNKRAKDFNPSSLKEYARRVRRAVELYEQWLANPAEFNVKTRMSNPRKERTASREAAAPIATPSGYPDLDRNTILQLPGSFQSAFPVRTGHVVTLVNIPEDLTSSEAERLAQFVRMLAVQ